MLERWAKIVGLVGGLLALLGMVSSFDSRVAKLEAQRIDEIEWRKWLVEQVGQIGVRVGATVVAPPPSVLAPLPPLTAPVSDGSTHR